MESLVSGAICGTSYHLFAGQPLTVVGSTGPVLVFETIVFKFCRSAMDCCNGPVTAGHPCIFVALML